LDGRLVKAFSCDPDTDHLSYTSQHLSMTLPSVRVLAEDARGVSELRTWSFSIGKI
jgi:hypothetical protein